VYGDNGLKGLFSSTGSSNILAVLRMNNLEFFKNLLIVFLRGYLKSIFFGRALL
jgi:hypothetical protein